MVTKDFIISIKLHPLPQWKIARLANLDPSTLSKIIIGCIDVTKDDPRLQRVCKVIGFPVENAIDGSPNSVDKEGGAVEL